MQVLESDFQNLTYFKYDGLPPTNVSYISSPSLNFGSVNDMNFSWPVSGGSIASDSSSGILGYQYQVNSTSSDSWKGSTSSSDLNISYIPHNVGDNSYTLSEADDGDDIIVGNNTVYFRSVDNSGRFSSRGYL